MGLMHSLVMLQLRLHFFYKIKWLALALVAIAESPVSAANQQQS